MGSNPQLPEQDKIKCKEKGSGFGTVGRTVASDTRDPWIESRHRQILFTINCIPRRDENKEKEAGNGAFLKLLMERKGCILCCKFVSVRVLVFDSGSMFTP